MQTSSSLRADDQTLSGLSCRDAIVNLRKALSATPNYPVAYFHMARTYDEMGNSAEAHESFEQAERMGFKPASMNFVERETSTAGCDGNRSNNKRV